MPSCADNRSRSSTLSIESKPKSRSGLFSSIFSCSAIPSTPLTALSITRTTSSCASPVAPFFPPTPRRPPPPPPPSRLWLRAASRRPKNDPAIHSIRITPISCAPLSHTASSNRPASSARIASAPSTPRFSRAYMPTSHAPQFTDTTLLPSTPAAAAAKPSRNPLAAP